MLLGIFGPHAVGKSTFIENYRDYWPGIVTPKGLVVVPADYEREYLYDPNRDCWVKHTDKPRWKGTREDKISHMEAMVEDHGVIWIVESARYFSGFQPDIVNFFRKYHGGVRFICITCAPQTMKIFIQERCTKQGKEFRADYWDDKRLAYECRDRYVNQAMNHYLPAGIDVTFVDIDSRRSNWGQVDKMVEVWMTKPWYRGDR